MCHFSVELDQSTNSVARVLDIIEAHTFYVRSIRLVPCGWSNKANVHLSLGGGSRHGLDMMVADVRQLPGVLSTHNAIPPV